VLRERRGIRLQPDPGLLRLEQRELNSLAHPEIDAQDLVSIVRGYINKRDGPRERAMIKAAECAQERLLEGEE
jgi:hypothetical protein